MGIRQQREHPAYRAQLSDVTTAEKGGEVLSLRGNALRLSQCLAHQSPGPQRQPSGYRGIGLDGLPPPRHRECRVPGVLLNLSDKFCRLRVEQLGDGPVEINCYAVSDISLYEAFQPVGRRGPGVEFVDRGDERLHRLVGIYSQFLQPTANQLEIVELGSGHLGERRLVGERLSERRIFGKTEKSHKQGVSQHAEQVDRATDPAIRLRIRGPGCALRRRAVRVILRHERSVTSLAAAQPACLTPPAHSMLLDCCVIRMWNAVTPTRRYTKRKARGLPGAATAPFKHRADSPVSVWLCASWHRAPTEDWITVRDVGLGRSSAPRTAGLDGGGSPDDRYMRHADRAGRRARHARHKQRQPGAG